MRRKLHSELVWPTVAVALLAAGCQPPTAAGPPVSPAAATPAVAPEVATASAGKSEEPTSSNAGGQDAIAAAQAAQPVATPKVNRPPRADRLPSNPGDAEKITFDDLNLQMLPNIVYRPFMVNDRVRELEGERVSIAGYMHGGAASSTGIKKFVLLKNTECKFGKDGQADHLAIVYLKSGSAANYTTSDIKVEGTLRIDPFTGDDGNTWSIYNLEEAVVR